MKWFSLLGCIGGLALLINSSARAGDPLPTATGPRYIQPDCRSPFQPVPPPYAVPGTTPPGTTSPGTTPPGQEPTTPSTIPPSAFAQAGEAGTQGAASFSPNMFGDLVGGSIATTIFVRRGNSPTATPVLVRIPIPAAASAFKISENESPRPQDRVFFAYNFYNDVNRSLNPGFSAPDLNRELIGFEKTFLSGDASFGIRLPFLQFTNNNNTVENSDIGDLSIIAKYAFINDRRTGNVLSGGMVLTLPTGKNIDIPDQSSLNATIFQPYMGFICNSGDFYLQGFSSLAVPTDSRDVTLFFNSLGLGFRLYNTTESGAFLTGIIPTVELHTNTPLNHRGSSNTPLGFTDQVDWTAGSYFVLRERSVLGVAIGAPLTGPRPFDFEAILNFNLRF